MVFKKFDYLINKSTKYLAFDLKYFMKGGFYLSVTQVFLALFAWILTWGLSTGLSKSDFGLFQFIISTLGVVSAFFGLGGAHTTVIISLAKKLDGTYNYLLKKRIVISSLGIFSLFIIAGFFYVSGRDNWYFFLLCALAFPFFNSLNLYNAIFIAKNQFRKQSFINIIKRGIFVSLIVLIALITKNLLYVILFYLVFTSISEYVAHSIAKKSLTNNLIDLTSLKNSLQISGIRILPFIIVHVDKLLVGYYFGLEMLANYSIAVFFSNQVGLLSGVIRDLFLPKMSSRNAKEVFNKIFNNLKWILLFSILLVLVISLVLPFFVKIFFEEFQSIILIAQILVLANVFNYLILIIQTYLTSQKDLKGLTYYSISHSLVYMGLLIALIIPFQIWGVVYAFIISNIFRMIYLYIVFIKQGRRVISSKSF